MSKFKLFLGSLIAVVSMPSYALVVDFEGIAPSGNQTYVQGEISSLNQDGFVFSTNHGHIWDSANPNWNGNGTDWFINDYTDPNSSEFTITRSDSALFSFDGLDAAQWDGAGVGSILISGYVNGVLVESASIELTSVWTTFDFGTAFGAVDAIMFDTNDYYTAGYDNIVLNASVPEPGTIALLGLGLVGMAFSRRRKIA